jgi:hypothetical protein
MDRENVSYSIHPNKRPIDDKNISYSTKSLVHENYWFQDLGNTIFNLDYALKIFPDSDMTYAEKINTLVRLSIYIGLILGLFYKNYLFLYIPIIVMVMTYLLYIFRIDQLEGLRQNQGPNSNLNSINQKNLDDLTKRNMSSSYSYGGDNPNSFKDILNIKTCSKPNTLNPFMNPLLTEILDNPDRPDAAPITSHEVKKQIEHAFQQTSDLHMDTSDRFDLSQAMRTFSTLQSATIPSNQDGFLKFLAKGQDEPDYSSAFPSRNAKEKSEGYVEALGSTKRLPNSTAKPTGTAPTGTGSTASALS